MKKALRNMFMTAAFVVIAALGLLAYIRLAPSDPAVWHVSPVTAAEAGQGACLDSLTTQINGARVACLSPDSPEALLSRLDQIAMATARTTRLDGTPQSGRITWVTRTALIGFPDYTTAEATSTATGSRLDIHARQRFGSADFGVNSQRLGKWLVALQP